MAQVFALFPEIYHRQCEAWQCIEDPQDVQPVPCHSEPEDAVHAHLKVIEPQSSVPGSIHVNVFSASKGTSVALDNLDSTDTVGKLKQRYLNEKPYFEETLLSTHLIYNGKPIELHQTLDELQVNHGDTLNTFHRWQCVEGDPKSILTVENTAGLKVTNAKSLVPGFINVIVFDGSTGIRISLILKRRDTIKKLLQMFLKKKQDYIESLNFIYNGKHVKSCQTLAELGVRKGDTFIIYYRCHGG